MEEDSILKPTGNSEKSQYSSKEKKYVSLISDIGVPYVGPIDEGNSYGVRVVGYFKKDITIVSGEGNRKNPYVIK